MSCSTCVVLDKDTKCPALRVWYWKDTKCPALPVWCWKDTKCPALQVSVRRWKEHYHVSCSLTFL